MRYVFFLSYARDNNDADEVTRFFEDLSAELLRQLGEKQDSEKIGFRDQYEKAGVEWERRLLEALQASARLVCLYSPAYFKSHWCGREWEVFRRRRELYLEEKNRAGENNPARPPVIIPLIWMPGGILDAVKEIQTYTFETPDDTYRKKGLFRLIHQYGKYKDEYDDFIFKLAWEILDEKELLLPALPPQYSVLSQISNAFQADGEASGLIESNPKDHERFNFPPEPLPNPKRRFIITWVSILILTIAIVTYFIATPKPEFETIEKSDTQDDRFQQWAPSDLGWKMERVSEAWGRRIKGDALGLFMTASAKKPLVNLYRDFTLEFDVRFIGKKGVAWIVRAKDFNNFYLLELSKSSNSVWPAELNFYVCEQGRQPRLLESARAEVNVEDDHDNFVITTEVRGNKFDISVRPTLHKEKGSPHLLVLTDNTFQYGGVGLLPKNGKEVLLQQWRVGPH